MPSVTLTRYPVSTLTPAPAVPALERLAASHTQPNTQDSMNIIEYFPTLVSGFAILAATFSAIFWMVVTWRAMRAHERIADAAQQAARKMRETAQ
jgi:hypothetical protein